MGVKNFGNNFPNGNKQEKGNMYTYVKIKKFPPLVSGIKSVEYDQKGEIIDVRYW